MDLKILLFISSHFTTLCLLPKLRELARTLGQYFTMVSFAYLPNVLVECSCLSEALKCFRSGFRLYWRQVLMISRSLRCGKHNADFGHCHILKRISWD